MAHTDDHSRDSIELSQMAEALIDSLQVRSKPKAPLEGEQYMVSETVSFFGFAYEKIRNAVEFNEEHLIRRLAIARILRRRLAINPKGIAEGENLAREILWGRYLPADQLSMTDIDLFQKIIDSYIAFFHKIKETHRISNVDTLNDIIFDLLSTEIEEALNSDVTAKKAAEMYFFYQTLVRKVRIEGESEETRDTYFYVAAEKALAKNDTAFIMYHLFVLRYGVLHTMSPEQIDATAREFHTYLSDSTKILNNEYDEKLTKFAKKQSAPFRILYSLLDKHPDEDQQRKIITSSASLKEAVQAVCEDRYKLTTLKLRNAAVRSITYIFLTKMILVLIFEIPVTRIIYGELHMLPIGINTLFPPVLMAIIVSIISPPSSQNTHRIFGRIVDILDSDPGFETKTTVIAQDGRSRRPILLLGFTLIYLLVFFTVFMGIYILLDLLGFNIISKAIFIFFISVVAFFGYRIRQTAKEYVLEMEGNVIISFITFLFLPILYLGKFLSKQVARINLFIILFDYIFEAPFKFVIEIVEEWSRFLKARKDELV